MNSLVRWNPMEAMVPWNFWGSLWDEDFDEVLERLGGSMDEKPMAWMPKVEAYRKNGNYVVKADLPGVKPEDIHVTVDNGCLAIRAEHEEEKKSKGKGRRGKEAFMGRFEGSVAIPEGLKLDKMKAKYHGGVLEISAPVDKEHPAREIKVEIR